MPVPSAFGSTFSARDTASSATFNAGNINLGTAGGNYVHGWVLTTGFSSAANADPSTGRPGAVTVGGVALTVGTPQDRNTVFGAGSGGWIAEVFGFVPSLTGSQAVQATQVTAGGAPSASGRLWIDLQVYNDVDTVPVKTAIALTTATAGAISTVFSSATGRLDVLSTHTGMTQAGAPAMTATAASPSTLRSSATPINTGAVIADRASAASTSLTVNTTGSFGFQFIGVQLSLAGAAGGTAPAITTHPADQTVAAGALASFTVAATGTGLAYQWQRGGVNISGATAATYSFTTAIGDSGAQFRCVVTGDTAPAATSNAATLTVTASSTFGASFPLGVAADITGASKRLSQAWTGYAIPWDAANPGAAAAANRTPISGTSASDGAITITGLPQAGSFMARIFFGSGASVAAYTLTGTAA